MAHGIWGKCDGGVAVGCQRRLRRFFGFGGVSAAVQNVATWRLASAVARPRAEPSMAFAPLSHMLRKGFFFVHGFFMICL
jgi:hypothetical protein